MSIGTIRKVGVLVGCLERVVGADDPFPWGMKSDVSGQLGLRNSYAIIFLDGSFQISVTN